MRRFYLQFQGAALSDQIMTGKDVHHIRNVLRMRTGDKIVLFNGIGMEARATIRSIEKDCVRVEILDTYPSIDESPLDLTVAQSFLKDKKMDELVRRLTELGTCRFVAFYSKRSVAIPGKSKIEERIDRWKGLSVETLKQCGRGQPMEIGFAGTFSELIRSSSGMACRIICWEEESPASSLPTLYKWKSSVGRAMIVMGPEGGFSAEEIAEAGQNGFSCMSLGPRILRAETATLAAVSIMQFHLGDMG